MLCSAGRLRALALPPRLKLARQQPDDLPLTRSGRALKRASEGEFDHTRGVSRRRAPSRFRHDPRTKIGGQNLAKTLAKSGQTCRFRFLRALEVAVFSCRARSCFFVARC